MFLMGKDAEKRLEVMISGMDCEECTRHVRDALMTVPGVDKAVVYLAAEKAVLSIDQTTFDMHSAQKAVIAAGYSIPEEVQEKETEFPDEGLARRVGLLTVSLFALILTIVIFGEFFGIFDFLMLYVPPLIGIVAVILAGLPIFRKVFIATKQRRVIAHTLMSVGVLAALLIGQWITALLVVFFMRIGDAIESYTAEQARQALRQLSRLSPQKARVVRHGKETSIPVEEVPVGDIVIIRPGEKVPVDGYVIDGQAAVDQATITGESMPVDVGPGASVFAASLVHMGSLRVQATAVGSDSTFGKIVQMVEEAEAHRGDIQRMADRFTQYYLPIVGFIAFLTLLIRQDPMATVAVLVVACSCSIALATPIAMLASIGKAAQRGILIKGGKFIELLDQVHVLLIDKTGTLTFGRPKLSRIVPLDGIDESELLVMAASAEKYSEHPLADAVRTAAAERGLTLIEPAQFEAITGLGVKAEVIGQKVTVGNRRLLGAIALAGAPEYFTDVGSAIYIAIDDTIVGFFEIADTMRPEVPQSLSRLQELGIEKMELITGDNQKTASALATKLGLAYQSELLPEDKIAIVKSYQEQGYKVLMVGDGVNDAPALAQADVGLAMGAAGSDVALEAAHVALLRDDWSLIPELFTITRRTMNVIKLNLGFTAVYNILGLSLAAIGILPPVLAAAAQSLPDLGILANSSRLLKD